jgi:electron transport complex protein RnfG
VVNQGSVDAVILPVIAPQGYTEAIRLIVGIDASGTVIGVRVTQHKETPGLGDQIETTKSDWIYAFNQTSLRNPSLNQWLVKKDGGDFDQLTGATITPRAIVKAVKNSLEFFQANRALLLTPAEIENNS